MQTRVQHPVTMGSRRLFGLLFAETALLQPYSCNFGPMQLAVTVYTLPEDVVNKPSINCFKDVLLNHLNLL